MKHDFFKNSFFPSTIIKWNKLESIETFEKKILSFFRPSPKSTFNCHNPKGIKLLSRLRLGLNHFREHKFKYSFQDSLNSFCSCGKGEAETSSHYLLHCSNYSGKRLALLNTKKKCWHVHITTKWFENNKSTFILVVTIDYIISTGRFDEPLFNSSWLAFVSIA